MDEQEINPGELQISQTLIKRAFEIGGRQPIVENLGRHEDVLAHKAGRAQPAAQPLPHLGLVAIALGGVDVPITEAKRGLDRFDADRIHQRHSSKPDRGDLCAVGLDDIHCVFPRFGRAISG
jgi:hypothetical protein